MNKKLILFLLTLIIGVIYSKTLTYPILWWDDRLHICVNPLFNSSKHFSLINIWSGSYWGIYAPVSYTFWQIILWLAQFIWDSGTDCLSYGPLFHGWNLFIHILNSILVFHLLKNNERATDFSEKGAFIGALIFALHPIQVETVAWISGERDLLMAFFGLLSLYLIQNKRYWSSSLCLILSGLSKPSGVVFILIALLLIYDQSSKERKKAFVKLSPAILGSLILAVLAKYLQADSLLRFDSSLSDRIFIFAHNLGFYFMKLIWPQDLVPDYGRSVFALKTNPQLFWSCLFLLIPIGLRILKRSTINPLIWILIFLLPYSGLLTFGFQEISTVADRFFYVPMVGVSLYALSFFKEKDKFKFLVGIALVMALAILSFKQIQYWRNDEILFTHNIENFPKSSLSNANLANYYFHNNRYQESKNYYNKALELDPRNSLIYLGLGRAFEKLQERDQAEKTYRLALSKNFANAEILNNLGSLIYGDKNDLSAEIYWKESTRLDSKFWEPRFNLGVFYSDQKKWDQAKFYLLEALEINPTNQLILQQLNELEHH